MKILILLNDGSGKLISGGDYHILRVIKEWNNSHHISLIIQLIRLLSCQPLLFDKYKVYLTSSGTKALESFRLIPAYFNRILKSMFLRFDDKPDVIVCSTHMLFDTLPGYILQFRFRTKLVVYVHHLIGKYSNDRRGILDRISIVGEKLSLPLIRSANIIFVVNEQVKSDLIEMRFDPSKIRVSSNGLDYDYIASINPTDNNRYDGCFCGRLVKRKGIYDLIRIWKLVTSRYPKSRLVIVGDGPEYTNLSNILKEMDLVENIRLTGFISERDKFLIMKSSKVFIFHYRTR